MLFVDYGCNIVLDSVVKMILKLPAYLDYRPEAGVIQVGKLLIFTSLYTSQRAFLSFFLAALQWPLRAIIHYYRPRLERDVLQIKGATEFIKENPNLILTVAHIKQWEKLTALKSKSTKIIQLAERPEPNVPVSLIEWSKLILLFFETAEGYFEALRDNSYNFSDEDSEKEWGGRFVEIDF